MFYKASRDGITISIFFKCEWQVTQVTICFISPHHTVGKVKVSVDCHIWCLGTGPKWCLCLHLENPICIRVYYLLPFALSDAILKRELSR